MKDSKDNGNIQIKDLDSCVLDLETTDVNSVLISIWFSSEFQQLLFKKWKDEQIRLHLERKYNSIAAQEMVTSAIKLIMGPQNVRASIANFVDDSGLPVKVTDVYAALNV